MFCQKEEEGKGRRQKKHLKMGYEGGKPFVFSYSQGKIGRSDGFFSFSSLGKVGVCGVGYRILRGVCGGKGGRWGYFFPTYTENSGIKVLSSLFFDQKKGPENKTEKKWVFLLRGKKWETRQYCFLYLLFFLREKIEFRFGAMPLSPRIFAFLATSRFDIVFGRGFPQT